jgi:type I restriction enzyme S subunit
LAQYDTRKANALPDGWELTKIGEITQLVEKVKPADNPDKEFVYVDISSIDNSINTITEPKVYRGTDAPSRARQQIQANDVLFSTVRTYLKNIALVPEAYDGQIASTGFSVLRTEDGILGKYLFYFTLTDDFIATVTALQRGVSYPAVRDRDVRDQWIPLAPLSEQHRIVAEIETQFTRLDAGVAALKRAQVNLRRYKASVLKAACEGRLVPTEAELARAERREYEPADVLLQRILAERRTKWEAENPGKKYKEPKPPDKSDLPELPEGWVWASLPQMGELGRGKSKHRPRNDERLFVGPYPFIQTGEVRRAEGTVTTYSQTYSEFGLAQSRLWPKGTLCITIAANIAETAILGFDACFPDSVVGFIPASGTDVRFVEYFIRTVREELEQWAPATAQKNINLKTLQGVAVPLPPQNEQLRIVAEVERRLSVVQELEKQVEVALKRAARLRQAILKHAFEGKLVPQDPEDESASVLLERIREERGLHIKGKKRIQQRQLPGL